MLLSYLHMDSPVGMLLIAESEAGITHVSLQEGPNPVVPEASWQSVTALQTDAVAQVQGYFEGTLRTFDLPLAPAGTPFQQAVWQTLLSIPYGHTCSYGDLAHQINNPGSVRAVGAANGKNPIAIIIPCHRVIGHNGKLTGYGGGLANKAFLLDHERKHAPQPGQQGSLF